MDNAQGERRIDQIETKPGTLLQHVSAANVRIENKHESACSTTSTVQILETSNNNTVLRAQQIQSSVGLQQQGIHEKLVLHKAHITGPQAVTNIQTKKIP